jgi:hypothetical protein
VASVFISFIHEEIEWAECVQGFINLILGSDAAPFMSSDKFQVYAGEKWLDRIMGELKESKVVLLMLSKESVKRPWVNFEAGAAWTRDIVTIPVCFGGLERGISRSRIQVCRQLIWIFLKIKSTWRDQSLIISGLPSPCK